MVLLLWAWSEETLLSEGLLRELHPRIELLLRPYREAVVPVRSVPLLELQPLMIVVVSPSASVATTSSVREVALLLISLG